MNPADRVIRVLFLLIYGLAAAGFLLPLVAPRSRAREALRLAGRFLQVLAFAGIVPSLQVLLDAAGISSGLPGRWPGVLTLCFNLLILAGLLGTVLIWYRLAGVYRPGPLRGERLAGLIPPAAGILWGLSGILQVPALLFRSWPALVAAQYGIQAFLALTALLYLAGTVRLWLPGGRGAVGSEDPDRVGDRQPGLGELRILGVIFPAGLILRLFLGSGAGRYLPPLLLGGGLLLGIRLYFLLFRQTPDLSESRRDFFRRTGLTPREQEIAELLAEGLSYREIAGRLFISLSTIQTHVTRVYGKTGVNSKTELARRLTEPEG